MQKRLAYLLSLFLPRQTREPVQFYRAYLFLADRPRVAVGSV